MALETVLRDVLSLPGVTGVGFLDSEGETIFHYGAEDPEKLKLTGAYQGIFLNAVTRIGALEEKTIISLYSNKSVLTRTLKDGYFITVIFQNASFGYICFRFQEICDWLEREL